MPLGVDYAEQDCSLARTIEVVGERWTLLILRDCFLGVRRFRDFEARLEISKAVLTQRLADLVDASLLERHSGGEPAGYGLTPLGRSLWPVLFAMLQWGDAHLAPDGPRRLFEHRTCSRVLEGDARCPGCGRQPDLEEIDTYPGPGLTHPRADPVSARLRTRRALLTPV